MNTKIIYCNNCGNEGHLYRHCRLPVLSYGILCINKDKLLMIQRKDSLSYIEFSTGSKVNLPLKRYNSFCGIVDSTFKSQFGVEVKILE